MAQGNNQETILIVGAGIFGVSTAYHLAQRVSDPSRIILLDRAAPPSNTLAASADINKIIRADYSSSLYMELGFEAIEAWKNIPALRDAGVYHQSGWIAMDEKGSVVPRRIRENFKATNHDCVLVDMGEEEVRRAWGGVLQRTDCSPFGSYYFNQLAGWVDAGLALQVLLQEAIKIGIRYEVGEARRLVLGEGGLQGVETMAGTVLRADKVLLATGAWTSKLMSELEDALNIAHADRVERQVSAAGVCVAHFQLSEEEKETYSKLPVLVYGEQGEVIPPTATGILKFTSTTSFKNTVKTACGHEISVPVEDQLNAPRGLQEDSIDAVRARLPPLLENGRKPDYYRLCWDSITASQHPLITRHPNPKLENLYFGVGGSFHFYKFLPTVGKYVINVLGGVSNGPVKDKAWSWKSAAESERGVHESLVPKHELKDFM
ncbi:NAD(P)/FAD-dependent oxidoreductase [Aspergillus undulatus]|uniref:NAD(P)/FAD-dependent oxidoreductase n=1 Tax=Aspergillus undulatus TaxID=1810928 RepID=UPI003CCDBE47